MDEARRFFRYVIPGSLFAVETILFLVILSPTWTIDKLKSLPTAAVSGIVAAVGALLVSGALGFLLSMLHHWLYWALLDSWGCVDYRHFVMYLQRHGVLRVHAVSSSTAPANRVFLAGCREDTLEAWTVFTGLWHERVGNHCHKVQAANPRGDSLANYVHANGAAKVGCWFAVISTVLIAHVHAVPFRWNGSIFIAIIIAVFLLRAHHQAYSYSVRIAQRLTEQVLGDALNEEAERNGPVQTSVSIFP